MTNKDRLYSEIDHFRYMILGQLSDDALDNGNEAMAWAYRWLRDNQKWPSRYYRWGGYDWEANDLKNNTDSFNLPREITDKIPDFSSIENGPNYPPRYRKSESTAIEAAALTITLTLYLNKDKGDAQ